MFKIRIRKRARQLNQEVTTTAYELWGRVQAAEKEHQAALDRYEAFGVPDSLSEEYLEYAELYRDAGRAWVDAEGARHELDAFLNPERYARKGYRAEALDKLRAIAEVDDPEIEPYG